MLLLRLAEDAFTSGKIQFNDFDVVCCKKSGISNFYGEEFITKTVSECSPKHIIVDGEP